MERNFKNEKIEKEVDKFLKNWSEKKENMLTRKGSFYLDEHTLIVIFTMIQDLENEAHFFSVVYLFKEKSHKRVYFENYESTRHYGHNDEMCIKKVTKAKIEGNSITMDVLTRSGKEKKIVRQIS